MEGEEIRSFIFGAALMPLRLPLIDLKCQEKNNTVSPRALGKLDLLTWVGLQLLWSLRLASFEANKKRLQFSKLRRSLSKHICRGKNRPDQARVPGVMFTWRGGFPGKCWVFFCYCFFFYFAFPLGVVVPKRRTGKFNQTAFRSGVFFFFDWL